MLFAITNRICVIMHQFTQQNPKLIIREFVVNMTKDIEMRIDRQSFLRTSHRYCRILEEFGTKKGNGLASPDVRKYARVVHAEHVCINSYARYSYVGSLVFLGRAKHEGGLGGKAMTAERRNWNAICDVFESVPHKITMIYVFKEVRIRRTRDGEQEAGKGWLKGGLKVTQELNNIECSIWPTIVDTIVAHHCSAEYCGSCEET